MFVICVLIPLFAAGSRSLTLTRRELYKLQRLGCNGDKKTDFDYAELPKNSTNSFKNTVSLYFVLVVRNYFSYMSILARLNDLFKVMKCISSNPKTVSRLLPLPFDCGAVASGLS